MKRKKTGPAFWSAFVLYLFFSESMATDAYSAVKVESENAKGKEMLARIVSRRMHDLFNWVQGLTKRDDGSFVG